MDDGDLPYLGTDGNDDHHHPIITRFHPTSGPHYSERPTQGAAHKWIMMIMLCLQISSAHSDKKLAGVLCDNYTGY